MSNNKNYSKTRMVTLFKRPGIFGAVYVVTIILAVLFIPNLAVKKGFAGLLIPVSYTHLTLPTKA